MELLRSSPQASRLYIELIRDTTSKYANWDPGRRIEVGDFGTINRKSGELEVKGNIYDPDTTIYRNEDTDTRAKVKKHPPVFGTRESDFYATSLNGTQIDLQVANQASVPGLAEASIKGKWSFNSRRGALLIMARPQSSYIPHGKFLEDLVKVKALKDMCLVTEVLYCSAFSLYLSNEKNDAVTLALLGSTPMPHVPSATVGGEVKVKWWSSNAAGLFRNGYEPDGKDNFAPLYRLQKIRTKERSRRGLPDPVYTGDDLWKDFEPPWDPLDEDGNEEESGDYYEGSDDSDSNSK